MILQGKITNCRGVQLYVNLCLGKKELIVLDHGWYSMRSMVERVDSQGGGHEAAAEADDAVAGHPPVAASFPAVGRLAHTPSANAAPHLGCASHR